MNQIKDLLKDTNLVIDFNDEDLDYIANNSVVLQLGKGKYLLEMGKYCADIFIICSGQVKIFLDSNLDLGNQSGFITYLKPGDIFGEMEMYEDRANIANAYTTEESTIVSIPKHLFKKRLLDRSELNFSLIKMILSKWKANERLYLSLIQKYESLIIENREQQQKLDYERNLKENFIINISHELRTPLTIIQGILDNIDTTSDMVSFPIYLYDKLNRSNRFLLDLINDLLDFRLLSEGTFTLNPIWYQFNLIGEKIIDLKELASKKGITLTFDIRDINRRENEFLFLLLDIKRINQIIFNLISNAIKFTENGEIHVLIEAKDFSENNCLLLISVKDSGIGISIEDRKKIFDKFVRIQKKYDGIEGTGLGLSIVKSLVTLMNGIIKVNSLLNKGSEFIIEIPVQYRIDSINQSKEKIKSSLNDSNDIRNVLIVDDFEDIHLIIKEMTKNLPVKIYSMVDGEGIINTVSKQEIDFILLDLMLPSCDGYSVLEELNEFYRNNPNHKNPKIIAFTALANQNELEKIRLAGFHGYLFKPFTKDELLEIIFSN